MRRALIGSCLVAAWAGIAAAQTPPDAPPPLREGNIWAGRDHEPDPAAVPQGSQAQQRRETDELERMAHDLLRRAQQPARPDCLAPPGPPAAAGLTAASTRSPMPAKAGENGCAPGPS